MRLLAREEVQPGSGLGRGTGIRPDRDCGRAAVPADRTTSRCTHDLRYSDDLTMGVQGLYLKIRSAICDRYRCFEPGFDHGFYRQQTTGVATAEYLPTPDFRRAVLRGVNRRLSAVRLGGDARWVIGGSDPIFTIGPVCIVAARHLGIVERFEAGSHSELPPGANSP